MYTDMLGTSVSVDYPDENGSMLKRENKIVPSSDEYDLTKRVLTLIDAQGSSGLGFVPLSRDDVERVYLADGIAVIEWKEGFTDKLKEALGYESAESADRLEMLIIYSFVNTLTELPYIKEVCISDAGKMDQSQEIGKWLLNSWTDGQRIRINIWKTKQKGL